MLIAKLRHDHDNCYIIIEIMVRFLLECLQSKNAVNCLSEIIMQLSTKGFNPFRPKLPTLDSDIPPDAVRLVTLSWQEDPSKRPSFEELIEMNNNLNQREYELLDSEMSI